jgi:hypothetical protein
MASGENSAELKTKSVISSQADWSELCLFLGISRLNFFYKESRLGFALKNIPASLEIAIK